MPADSSHTQRLPVLLYHRIDDEADKHWRRFCVAPGRFAEQMAWLAAQGYRTIDLHALLDYYEHGRPVPEKAMVITFDDGYYCNYSRAFPVMAKFNFTGTIFLAAHLMRTAEAAPPEGRHSFLSWPEIHEMQAHGWSFQSHGLAHVNLTTLAAAPLWHEVAHSRTLLAEKLGRPVDFFCYPFAGFNAQVMAAVAKAGYRGACGGPPFYAGGPASPFAIGRTEILWQDSFAQFRFKVQQGLGYYYFTRRQLGKIKRLLLQR
ncbi:MAG: polysaccharide deacetylase family protein [candidate division KSB1 bacterium]|nr:polysaccharide deacetylase family protein [candidate division KSB1 bacterium]MDZ7275969.1 polysaccharide deacetylase family protein [candidate division KSB1 bacterium]MDZ7285749.1 polysaccharide deacetylase family protein [candidate division KSB1 bacterium]MDZ7298781.1 polysaccharide deacetylase family protein [candidate division KSB1 bacterium]MDZ7307929.1 polysaccharide deacetylase family protein [candidate division KSB1 bacterium]